MNIILAFLGFVAITGNASFGQDFKTYIVRKGDTLWKITKGDWRKIETLMKVNKIDEKHLRCGMKLLIPKKEFFPVPKNISIHQGRVVVVFLAKQYFGAYQDGKLWLWGPISSGKKDYETPKGKFHVRWKRKHYFSKKYNHAPMPFAINFSSAGYFMHVQSLPGKPASHGCIRLLRKDGKKLFYWLRKGDLILIK